MSAKVPTTNAQGAFPTNFKYSPLEYVRMLFTGFFQGLFRAAEKGMYHWSEEEDLTEIYISSESPVKASDIGQRPAISLTRAPVRFFSLGLDDMKEFDMATESKEKSVLVPGTMIINCSSRVSLESERLAWICAESLWLHRELLMKAGFFDVGRTPEIGSPSPAGSIVVSDGNDEWFTTAVACPYQFYRTSRVTPLGQKIVHDLVFTFRTRLQKAMEQQLTTGGRCGPIAGPGPDVPVSITECLPPPFAPAASDVYGHTPRPGQGPPHLQVQPHPLNPARLVVVRGIRPNCPALKPPGMGGRAIPIASTSVEESCGRQTDDHVSDSRTFKV